MTTLSEAYAALPSAGLFRRLLAMVYDLVLLLAVLYCAEGLLLLVTAGHANAPGNPLVSAYLLAVCFIFYGWFWMNGGQTLGLRAWRLQLVTLDGRPLTWGVTMLRFTLGLVTCGFFGAGLLWMYFDRDGLPIYDRFSGTRLVQLPKKPRTED